jgi:zinc protease
MKRRVLLGLGLLPGALGVGFAVYTSVVRAQVTDWPSERPPQPLPARAVKFPPYEVRTLANGLQVVTVSHHEQPAVSMRMVVRAGSVQDLPGKAGVAALAAALLDQGTTTRTAEQIADQIDFIGGELATGSGSDVSFVNVVVMKDSFAVAMELLSDVVRNPAFAPEEIERQTQQSMSSMQVSAEDPDYIAGTLFDRLVYGFHPYGLPNSGTPQTLAAITRADLQAYHRRNFVPNNMILAIVGDVTSVEGFAAAERVFGAWPRADVEPVKVTDPPPPTRRIVIVDKPDAVQTEIRVGQIAIQRKHDDYLAFDLAVKILGGEGANRLHRVLRSERGLTYGASAEAETHKQTGDFVAETDTRTETTGEALRLMVDEIAKLPRDRVSERELADAQAYLAGSFPLTIETPNDIATQVLNVVFYDLPLEEIGTFRERVQRVTPDDIQRVARAYVRPDRLSIVLVGNAAAFVPQLRQVGFSDFEVVPIDELDILSATLRRDR